MLSKTLSAQFETLLLPTDRGMKEIQVNSIIRVEALRNYSKLFFSDGKTLVVARVLRWFEETLKDSYFLRIHHKHLVNRQWIKGHTSDSAKLLLHNSDVLAVSRRKKAVLKSISIPNNIVQLSTC